MRTARRSIRVAALLLGLVPGLAGPGAAQGPLWEADGFAAPESAYHDAARNVIYVANVAGAPNAHDGNGYISRLSPEGRVLEAAWVRGLDAPKGMAVDGTLLYVADIDKLVVIDIDAGAILARYPAMGAKFLNDVALGPGGRVYVSDTLDDAIWRLEEGRFDLWMRDRGLLSPNGLLAEADRLVVAPLGHRTAGFATDTPGHLLTVRYRDRRIADLGDGAPLGTLDGIVSDGGDGYYVTDHPTGRVLHVAADGTARTALELVPGTADLGADPGRKALFIPLMRDGRVVAYPMP